MNSNNTRIVLLSNINLLPYFNPFLRDYFSPAEITIDFVPYAEYGKSEYADSLNLADYVVVCLNAEAFVTNGDSSEETLICVSEQIYDYFLSLKPKHIIWFLFEDYYMKYHVIRGFVSDGLIDRVNSKLIEKLRDDNKVIIIDLKYIIAQVGVEHAYNSKNKYRWNAPYSKDLVRFIANEVYKQHLIIVGNTKKCLVLDCDNVLWGGILLEDGIEGIQISVTGAGQQYRDFQKFILCLYRHGIILAVCSKNEESEVLRVFREHTGMLLKEEHIACFSCNWDNKSDNIKYISNCLNIGFDSIVFVDDSIYEIESVKAMLPEVKAVLYGRDTIYDELSCFNLKRDIDLQVVRERNNTYKTNILRAELHKNSLSYEDYISSLEMVVDIHEAKIHELSRISDLTQRTNKCTNGRRYTLENLKEKFSLCNYKLYTVCLSDKFSNLGIVGAVGIENNSIDLFSLSCRALGRGVEDKMLHMVIEKGINNTSFTDTGKNISLIECMKRLGIKIPE